MDARNRVIRIQLSLFIQCPIIIVHVKTSSILGDRRLMTILCSDSFGPSTDYPRLLPILLSNIG